MHSPSALRCITALGTLRVEPRRVFPLCLDTLHYLGRLKLVIHQLKFNITSYRPRTNPPNTPNHNSPSAEALFSKNKTKDGYTDRNAQAQRDVAHQPLNQKANSQHGSNPPEFQNREGKDQNKKKKP